VGYRGAHFISLLLRIIASVRIKFWKRSSVFAFSSPARKVRIGFTVKVLRQEEGMAGARASVEAQVLRQTWEGKNCVRTLSNLLSDLSREA
jgi:hypothetical protein